MPVTLRNALAAFAAIAMVPGVAVVAAPAAAQTSDLAFEDMFDAMNEGVDHEIALDNTMQVVRREYAAIPMFSKMEEESPGLLDDLISEMRPTFRAYQERVRNGYRPQMIALFAQYLSPDEARDIAQFYRSDLGKRILRGVSRNYSPDSTLSDIENYDSISQGEAEKNVASDLGNASAATIAELSQDDIAEMGRRAIANPGLLKLAQVNPGIVALRAEMEQTPLTPTEEARIVAAVEGVFERRLGR